MAGKRRHIPAGLKHSVWGVLDAALYPAIYMAMVPMMILGLGTEAFGLWIVLNTLMTTLQLFNLNIGLTTVKQLAACAGRKDYEGTNRMLSAILTVTISLLLLVTLIGGVISLVQPRWNFLGIGAATAGNVTACILLSALITGLKYLDQVFQSVLKGHELFRLAAILNLVNRCGLLLLNVLLAISGASIITLLFANLVYTIVYLLIHWLFIRRSLSFIRFSLRPRREEIGAVLSFSVWPWLQSIIVVIAFQTDRFWVSSHSGLEAVSAYGLVATMFNHIHMIFIAMAAWILPRISGMVEQGDNPGEIYGQVRGLLFAVVVSGLLLFYYASPFLFRVWVGAPMAATMAPYIKAFTVFELLFAYTIMPFFYLNASGHERKAAAITLLYSAVCYLFMIGGLKLFGSPEYMVHCMSLSFCLTMPVVNYLVRKNLNGYAAWGEVLVEMSPVYLAVLVIYMPHLWMSLLALPIVAVLLYQYYLSPVIEQRLWKPSAKL